MRYTGKDFPLQDPTETADLTFDFTRHPEWIRWDWIIDATSAVTVVDGTDASSASRLVDTPSWCDGRAIQTFANPVDGVKYKVAITATTNRGQTLALYSNVTGQA